MVKNFRSILQGKLDKLKILKKNIYKKDNIHKGLKL